MGQFRIPIEKMLPYETDIRIPLFISGPGIKAGTTLTQPVMNIDIAPTLLDLAGLAVPAIMDGQSLAPLLTTGNAGPNWRTRFASEFAEGNYQNYGPFKGAPGLYDNPDNQWRMLRVLNDTHNIAYMVSKDGLVEPFIYFKKNEHFTKTGSGQTWGKLKKRLPYSLRNGIRNMSLTGLTSESITILQQIHGRGSICGIAHRSRPRDRCTQSL